MKIDIKTLPELRSARGITKKMFKEKDITSQTYLNMIEWKNKPTQMTVSKFCDLFEIDEKTFRRLLKNTVPNEQ